MMLPFQVIMLFVSGAETAVAVGQLVGDHFAGSLLYVPGVCLVQFLPGDTGKHHGVCEDRRRIGVSDIL